MDACDDGEQEAREMKLLRDKSCSIAAAVEAVLSRRNYILYMILFTTGAHWRISLQATDSPHHPLHQQKGLRRFKAATCDWSKSK